MRKARIATLGLNPSKREFLDQQGRELSGSNRRLETVASLLADGVRPSSSTGVRRVFDACNNYFRHNPYNWFDRLERVLNQLGASYYKGTACHLDLVQWATDPTWQKLPESKRLKLLESDLSFLRQQMWSEHIKILLLNGRGVIKAYRKYFGRQLYLLPSRVDGRIRIFGHRERTGLLVLGWNINLQSSFGVSSREITMIAKGIARMVKDSARKVPEDEDI